MAAFDFSEFIKRAIKYIVEGIMVAIAAFVIPQRKMKVEEVVIIALTAAVLSTEVEEMFAIGINHYLTKPINPNELKNIILNIVSNTKGEFFETQDTIIQKEATKEKATTTAETTQKGTMTIGLDYLKDFSGGDTGFMTEMMKMFLEQVPDEATKMLDLLRDESWEELGKLAHKMKPNFLMMGLKDQQMISLEIETLCKTDDFDKEYVTSLTEELVEDAFQSLPLLEEAMNGL